MKCSSDLRRLGLATLLLGVPVVLLASGCEEYLDVPRAELVAPPTGTFFVGDPIELAFDAPVDPDTLVIHIWPDERDLEYELIAETPVLDSCTPGGDCGPNTLTAHEDGLGATLELDPESVGRPDVPLILEVAPGLRGTNGSTLRYRQLFDFQFKPLEDDGDDLPVPGDPDYVEFQAGGYTLVAILEQPLPLIINLVLDMERGPGNQVAALGSEADPIGDAPENTGQASELEVDRSEQGFVIFAPVQLRLAEDGTRFFESEPFDINLTFGTIYAQVADTRLTGTLSTDPDTGNERIDGTMSFGGFNLDIEGGTPFSYDASTTTFVALWWPRDEMPEGSPQICTDPCGAVTAQCEPPDDFPGEGFCVDGAEADGTDVDGTDADGSGADGRGEQP